MLLSCFDIILNLRNIQMNQGLSVRLTVTAPESSWWQLGLIPGGVKALEASVPSYSHSQMSVSENRNHFKSSTPAIGYWPLLFEQTHTHLNDSVLFVVCFNYNGTSLVINTIY